VIAEIAIRLHHWIVGERESTPKEKETKNETHDSVDHAGGRWSFCAIDRFRECSVRSGLVHSVQTGSEKAQQEVLEEIEDLHPGCCSRGEDRYPG
jgi:hypothetical protein